MKGQEKDKAQDKHRVNHLFRLLWTFALFMFPKKLQIQKTYRRDLLSHPTNLVNYLRPQCKNIILPSEDFFTLQKTFSDHKCTFF